MRHYVNLKSYLNDHVNIFKKMSKIWILRNSTTCQVNMQNSEKWKCFFASPKSIFTVTEISGSTCFELNKCMDSSRNSESYWTCRLNRLLIQKAVKA